MARKSAKKPAPAVVDTTLAVSELRIRLEFLEQDNQKLIGKIEKKRSELNNLVDRIREISVEISQRTGPVVQQLLEFDRKMHAVFKEIFAGKKLGKQTLKKIMTVYENLQLAGVISVQQRDAKSEQKSVDTDADTDESQWDWGEKRSSFDDQDSAPKLDRDELKKIRQLFLRLAEVFHPDKVTDDRLRAYHTEVMQEINEAYQSGDLAKLLAIEKKHQMGEVIDLDNQSELAKRCAKIEQENDFLKSQFENIKSELKAYKSTPQGAMVAEYKKLSKAGIDPVGEAVAQTKSQVEAIAEIYQFVLDFRDRRITIRDFMEGPEAFYDNYEDDDYDEYDDGDFYLDFMGK